MMNTMSKTREGPSTDLWDIEILKATVLSEGQVFSLVMVGNVCRYLYSLHLARGRDGGAVLTRWGEARPGKLLSMLQCKGHPHIEMNYLTQNVNSAVVKNLDLDMGRRSSQP